MKKVVKMLCLVLVIAMVMSPIALSMSFSDVSVDTDSTLANIVRDGGATVTGVIRVLGYVIAVVMVTWLGIQYLIATPAKKAELKGKLWSMAIGVVLLVAGVTILDVVASGFTDVATNLPK